MSIDFVASPVRGKNTGKHLNATIFKVCDYDSKYVTEDKVNEFFHFDDLSAINLLHVNCRSLKKNFDSVKLLLANISCPLTALALSETWLIPAFNDMHNLPRYIFVSNPRLHKRGGGVGI